MRLLLDNTGLHSAARVIFGSAASETDVKGLIQLCSLLMFSNELHLAGLEADAVKGHTIQIIEELRILGVDNDILTHDPYDEQIFKRACKEVADNCLLTRNFDIDLDKPLEFSSVRPSNLHLSSLETRPDLESILRDDLTHKDLEELASKYLEKKMDGVIYYMICISPFLRKIFQYQFSKKLSESQILQLITFLRFSLNEQIAKDKKYNYTPSVGRANLIRRDNNFILNELSNAIDKSIAEYQSQTLEIPSLTKYLLSKSGGNPYKMIDVALDVRHKTATLRQWTEDLLKKYGSNSASDKFELKENIKEIGKALTMSLGVDKPTLINSLEISLSYAFIPNIKINSKELLKWISYKKHQKKISVLTEISKENIFNDLKIDKNELYKFINNR